MMWGGRSFALYAAVAASCMLFPSAAHAENEAAKAETPSPSTANPLPIDMLYAIPNLAGTSPESAAWSPDGRSVAFLWNDKGGRFRDIWVYSPSSGQLRRATRAAGREKDSWNQGISGFAWARGQDHEFVYLVNGKLWLSETGGQSRPLFPQRSGVRELHNSPDGRYLSFIEGGDPGENSNVVLPGGGLWIADLEAAGELTAHQVVSGGNLSYVDSYRWGDDGKRIGFVHADKSRMRKYDLHFQLDTEERVDPIIRSFPGDDTATYRIGAVRPDGSDLRFFSRPEAHDPIWNIALSPDSNRLLENGSDFLVKNHWVAVYDLTTGKREIFYKNGDPRQVRWDWQAEWAPDGKGILLQTDDDGYTHIHSIARPGAKLRLLTPGRYDVESFSVDRLHKQVYFVSNASHVAERQVYRVRADGGPIERLTEGAGTHQPVLSPDFSQMVDRFSNDATPTELYVSAVSQGAPRAITHSPLPEFKAIKWADVRYVSFPSHVDGAPLVGRLILPRNYDPEKRYPLIVGSVYRDTVRNQWGGRAAHPNWGIDQNLAARGYMILAVNMRGSWGQGKAHAEGLRSYGGIDIDDLESGVRYLTAQHMIDPKRVGIWGSSYGGLMTLMSMFKKPDVYAVGIAGAPASNVWHAEPQQMRVMGEPQGADFPARYERQSALYQSSGLKHPLMIVHGTKDRTVLFADTQALVQRLINDGKSFELVALPGSDHSWTTHSLEQTRFAYKKMVEFFDRNLHPEQ